jgi:hypothetical protein
VSTDPAGQAAHRGAFIGGTFVDIPRGEGQGQSQLTTESSIQIAEMPGVALKASRIAGFASLGSPSWTFALRGAS